MEKSLVRQFNGFANSIAPNNTKNTFIRTFHHQNNLAKSRIQNLPSYKKDDLSKRLDMVVIFQSIQIQRLSLEIQSLRIQLKDSQRQLKNYLSYQVQIKELTQYCSQLEEQNYRYKDQIQKINIICQKLYSQLQEMHQKYDHIDLQLEAKFRKSLQQNQSLTQQMQRLKQKFDQKQQEIKKQNKQLEKTMQKQQYQIQKLQKSLIQAKQNCYANQELMNQLKRLKESDQKLNSQLLELNEQIDHKSMHLQNLRTVLKSKINQGEVQKNRSIQIHQLVNSKLDQLQRTYSQQNQKAQNQIKSLLNQNQSLIEQIGQKQKDFIEFTRMHQDQLVQYLSKLQQQESKFLMHKNQFNNLVEVKKTLQKQNKSLIQNLKQKDNQLMNIKGQFVNDVMILNRQKQNLQQKMILLLKQFDIKSEQLNQIKASILNFRVQNQRSLKCKNKYVQQYDQAIKQMQKLYHQFDKERSKSYELQCKVQDLEYSHKKLINEKQRSLESMQNQRKQLLSDKSKMEHQIRSMNSDFDIKFNQKQKAYNLSLQALKSENQKLVLIQRRKLQQISHQLQSINYAYNQLSKTNILSNEQVSSLKQITQNQSSLINRINKQLQICQKQIKQAKNKVQNNLQTNSKNFNNRFMNDKVNDIFEVSEIFVQKIIKLQDQVALLQNQNFKLQSQKKILDFQMVQIHKTNSMQKRRDSRNSTDSSSLRTFVNSSAMIKNKDKFGSFIRSTNKQSTTSSISENQSMDRKIFAPLSQNKY